MPLLLESHLHIQPFLIEWTRKQGSSSQSYRTERVSCIPHPRTHSPSTAEGNQHIRATSELWKTKGQRKAHGWRLLSGKIRLLQSVCVKISRAFKPRGLRRAAAAVPLQKEAVSIINGYNPAGLQISSSLTPAQSSHAQHCSAYSYPKASFWDAPHTACQMSGWTITSGDWHEGRELWQSLAEAFSTTKHTHLFFFLPKTQLVKRERKGERRKKKKEKEIKREQGSKLLFLSAN